MDSKKGYVINDPTYGSIIIGSDKGVEGVTRSSNIRITEATGGCLKFFDDGGFELQGQPTAKKGDNIASRAPDGLNITGRNIHLDAGTGTLTISARTIVFEGSGETVVLRSNGNLNLDAADSLNLTGSVVAVGAKTKLMMGSSGPVNIYSKTGVSIVEPKISLCPANLLESITTSLTTTFPFLK